MDVRDLAAAILSSSAAFHELAVAFGNGNTNNDQPAIAEARAGMNQCVNELAVKLNAFKESIVKECSTAGKDPGYFDNSTGD